MARFYNPGQEINDRLQYTHPTKDPREGNTTSYHLMEAPREDFFEIPDQLVIDSPEGEIQVPVNFGKRIKALYQARGVIQVIEGKKDVSEDDNVAASDKEAKIKGAAMWREYLKAMVQQHYTSVAEVKSFGGVPRAAQGLTKYAIKFLNMEDPADQVDTITRAKEGQTSNADMQAKIDQLTATVNQLIGAKNGASQSRT